ncbi:hypothetical protein [Roseinatronobacter alkalisoli]|uniref:Uncharacterized protein n=1 Tax=Roseinatronobacter alkalisoli TaxID=3028235 RepID=A0ABT5TDK2_9RHOB|nr:hypothetical protein [Roseinatronobacter sp. HJB301]MDD7973196.1 hypothetical protein [Roseinatronobacter sp. HJB301]
MMKEELERYHNDGAWRAAYEAALAEADQAGSGEPMKAIQFAFATANAFTDGRQDAAAQRERSLEATRQRIAAHEAKEAARAEAEKPNLAQAALSAAVGRINASRGVTNQEAGDAAPAQDERAGAHTEAKDNDGQVSTTDAQAALRRAAERINATR